MSSTLVQETQQMGASSRDAVRLAGVDGRCGAAKRYKQLVESFVAEAGGFEQVSASGLALIQRLSSVTLQAEELSSSSAQGAAIDPVVYVSTINSSRRLLKDFARMITPQKRSGPKPKRPILTLPEAKPPAFHEVVAQVIAAREKDVTP